MKEQPEATELTPQDYKNIIVLINESPILGKQSTAVSVLIYKLSLLATPKEEKKDK